MKFEHIGWCKEDKHDKVWGILLLAEDVVIGEDAWPFRSNKYVTFWGRRGAKLQTKVWHGSEAEAEDQFRKKQKKGYGRVDEDALNMVYPEFQEDLEKTAIWELLRS